VQFVDNDKRSCVQQWRSSWIVAYTKIIAGRAPSVRESLPLLAEHLLNFRAQTGYFGATEKCRTQTKQTKIDQDEQGQDELENRICQIWCERTYNDLENRWLESMPSEYIASYKPT
jgi:hypothetical protein